jgi:hypothetical protein
MDIAGWSQKLTSDSQLAHIFKNDVNGMQHFFADKGPRAVIEQVTDKERMGYLAGGPYEEAYHQTHRKKTRM